MLGNGVHCGRRGSEQMLEVGVAIINQFEALKSLRALHACNVQAWM